jgi:arsenate reductase (thioredoxin)
VKKTNVLFVCVGNSCRSQLAEGYGRAWGSTVMNVQSAGTHAIDTISREIREVMAEEDIDISGQYPKQLSAKMVRWADRVIVLGGTPELIYPDLLHGKMVSWPTPDPYGQPVEEARRVRNLIKTRVTDLIIDLGREDDIGNR